MVEALRYKPEGCGFDSLCCRWNFSLRYSSRLHYGSGVKSASNIQEYQEDFPGGKGSRCVELTTLPPSCADFFFDRGTSTLRACPGIALSLLFVWNKYNVLLMDLLHRQTLIVVRFQAQNFLNSKHSRPAVGPNQWLPRTFPRRQGGHPAFLTEVFLGITQWPQINSGRYTKLYGD